MFIAYQYKCTTHKDEYNKRFFFFLRIKLDCLLYINSWWFSFLKYLIYKLTLYVQKQTYKH